MPLEFSAQSKARVEKALAQYPNKQAALLPVLHIAQDEFGHLPDDVLELVAKNGGVVMVNFFPGFIVPEAARASKEMFQEARALRKKYPKEDEFLLALKDWQRAHPIPTGSVRNVVDHIEHIAKVAGIDHVGLGSDFDGVPVVPKQLEDVSYYPYITQELLDRGHSREDIHKILGGNLLRALRQAEQVAKNGKS